MGVVEACSCRGEVAFWDVLMERYGSVSVTERGGDAFCEAAWRVLRGFGV